MVLSPVENVIARIREIAGDRVSQGQADREAHSHGESWHAAPLPDAVVYAQNAEEVARIARICHDARVPLIPFGTGTSLEGHVTAVKGGITLDLSRMNKIVEVNSEDLDCTIEPGVTRLQLNDHIRDRGLFFPIDPGADASLGGMASTRASGTNAVRYGTMRENVLALEVVLADGTALRTGTRARKSAAGYDLTKLFVGAEGTLGIITRLSLRLHGIPETIVAAVCSFETLGGAVDTVIQTIQSGIPIARVELLDDVQMDAVNRYSKLSYAATSTLFFEFHGTPRAVEEHVARVREIASENGGGAFSWAENTEQRNALWKARHTAYYAALALRPGSKGWSTDVCVPISRLTQCVLQTKADIEASGLLAPIVGHVGDGNFHLAHVIDPDDRDLLARTYAFNERLADRALAFGGTCTGEHGIGTGKMRFLEIEAGEGAIETMSRIKRTLDPNNIMNPGKILRLPENSDAAKLF
ncbi:FAD-binding protein [Mesorhizobium sp. CO1-1-11]|uniref:FAD-binding oxidoreductase n=1 Tax=Mesorhizobium sp. CO1-1-11 TaxID=2876636 RepID=UPI001CCFF39A|nr:FAD-linked oxidase C-terminal domain-containing protein [Mesorhizobium sp. CO1-1-11]MBZ9726309.1 FAD-binding protein [Mesorhizobium sp. CO1-1-11]